jgi:hypothetical protein
LRAIAIDLSQKRAAAQTGEPVIGVETAVSTVA